MGILRCKQGGQKWQRNARAERTSGARLAALLLCLSILAGCLPTLAAAAEDQKLSGIVNFSSISLHYAGADGQAVGKPVENNALIGADDELVLSYTFEITEKQCGKILANTPYYLEVSPHLVLPSLANGSPLTLKTEDGLEVQFGEICAGGNRAWVNFDAKENSSDTILSEYGELKNAFFYLNCSRAGNPPSGESPIDGHQNLYAMKFENNSQLNFGYAENEPVTAKAQIQKDGSLKDKTITWTITYTPWQNPSSTDPVTLDTPFELRDTIDTSLLSYVSDSAEIDGVSVSEYSSRDDIPENTEAYVLHESDTLIFGGTKLNAGEATQGNPAAELTITYQTSIKDTLLLPGGSGGQKITNNAALFADKGEGVFNSLGISSGSTVSVPQPTWLTKTGTTTRNPGNGSTTAWTVTFQPNGFTFGGENNLTLHDQLPEGSTLVENSVKLNGNTTTATASAGNAEDSFTVTVPEVSTGQDSVTITYQTQVPEEMYDKGTNLGSNVAWFTFQYDGTEYITPPVNHKVGSGDGSQEPGTDPLVKTAGEYIAKDRSITWTVKINPHRADLQSGTFTDDLSEIGPDCNKGHTRGLEVVGGEDGIQVSVGGTPLADNDNRVNVAYSNQVITVTTENVGRNTITLTYTTKVCDPCVFANNTAKASFTNTISTTDMKIGSQPARPTSASSTVDVSTLVLSKKAPVYDYAAGVMKWEVDVNTAKLPMTDVVLTDELPEGLTYIDGSLETTLAISDASASVDGQTLTINLGDVTGTATVNFDTKADPETLGFGGDQPVVVNNTIHMNGKADSVKFAEVSHSVTRSFSNHGLVKSSTVDNRQELIQYEVLVNPFGLALPGNPSLVDTLDKRLQLDSDTLCFYKAALTGTTAGTANDQKPEYKKVGDGERLNVTGFDPSTNSFTVQLPIKANSRAAYVLTYTADIIDHQTGSYGNSVRFDGGSVLLGGNQNNSASVGGGGGGGGGGVAARKATIAVVKTDSETDEPLAGVTFLLYQWDSDSNTRGLPFAQGETDAKGSLSFKVKPNAVYELVESGSLPGYGSELGWETLPDGVEQTGSGLLIPAGAAKSELKLALTNQAHTTDLVFRLVNEAGIPMAGTTVSLFKTDPSGIQDPVPDEKVTVDSDGTVRFLSVRRGAAYYIQRPDGGIMTINVPFEIGAEPTVELPDGTKATLTENYQATGITPPDQQWSLTVHKVISGGTTPLAGAEIGLYADETCQTFIKSDVSGQDGTITFSGLIQGQSYWLKERTAPSRYTLDSTVYEANCDADETDVTISNTPAPSGHPGGSGTPSEPEPPDEPGEPEEPGGPDEPGSPGEPGGPDEPDSPDTPGGPGKPGGPGEPGDPNRPNPPGSGGAGAVSNMSGGNGSGESDVPQTGDDTWLLLLTALSSGGALAAMAGYHFLGKKRRKQRKQKRQK